MGSVALDSLKLQFLVSDQSKRTLTITNTPLEFEHFRFPGGESHVKIKTDVHNDGVLVTARLRNGDDFMSLALAADAIRRAGGRPYAFIPYFPYARQDRQMVDGEPLSLRVAADLVNAMRFNRVVVYDPHSDVTPALLNNCQVITNYRFIDWVLSFFEENDALFVSPDAGASKKQAKLLQRLQDRWKSRRFDSATANKVRDLATGKIIKQSIDGDVAGRKCLIIDDICDGGRTFTGLADELRAAGAAEVHLAVSHGIFSAGLDVLKGKLNRVFVTDSYLDWDWQLDPEVRRCFIYRYQVNVHDLS